MIFADAEGEEHVVGDDGVGAHDHAIVIDERCAEIVVIAHKQQIVVGRRGIVERDHTRAFPLFRNRIDVLVGGRQVQAVFGELRGVDDVHKIAAGDGHHVAGQSGAGQRDLSRCPLFQIVASAENVGGAAGIDFHDALVEEVARVAAQPATVALEDEILLVAQRQNLAHRRMAVVCLGGA